jgi:hypothetical protein
MTDQTTLSAENILKAIKARPEGFLVIDFDKVARTSKTSTNKYIDCSIILEDGQKKKLGMSWKMAALTGGIKAPDDRGKYSATIQFRKTSGLLGEASLAIYSEFKRLTKKALDDKVLKIKAGPKTEIRTIIQDELEDGTDLDDPIIRFKIPFRNNRPEFKLVRIEEDKNGNPKPVEIKCNEDDVHTLIRSRMITSGFVSIDTVVFSNFGISLLAKVQLLVIKPVENDSPEVDSILSREEMIAMMGEPEENVSNLEEKKEEVEDKDEDEDEEKENTQSTFEKLKGLSKLALNKKEKKEEEEEEEEDDEDKENEEEDQD